MNQAQLPVPPAPPSPDVVVTDGGKFIHVGQGFGQAQSNALMEARHALENARNVVQGQRQKFATNDASRAQFDQQIAQIDQQIATIDHTIAGGQGDASPESWQILSPPSFPSDHVLPKDIAMLSGLFIVCVLFPLAIALSLRFLKRGAAKVAALPNDIAERLGRMEAAIEATAIEVERVGEGQRYLTRVLGDRKAEELLERNRPVAPYKVITPH